MLGVREKSCRNYQKGHSSRSNTLLVPTRNKEALASKDP